MYKDFEDYLQFKHGELNPEILDDDIPDHYADWIAELDVDTVIDWANKYSEEALSSERSKREKVERDNAILRSANEERRIELTSLKAENERLKEYKAWKEMLSDELELEMEEGVRKSVCVGQLIKKLSSLRSCLEKARIDIKCLVNAVENNRECLFCMKNSITIKEHNGECCLKDFNKTLTSIDEVMKG